MRSGKRNEPSQPVLFVQKHQKVKQGFRTLFKSDI